MEMQIVLTMIAQRYRVDLAPGHPVIPKPGITLGQKEGMFMTLHPHAPRAGDKPAPSGAAAGAAHDGGAPPGTASSSTRTG
jgi:hypothetical protein